jgi:hypothetical protein
MSVVLIDEENLLDKTLLQSFRRRTCVFVVVRTSSGRDSLYASFFSKYHRDTHQRRFARKQIDCSGVVFLKDLLSVLPGESG